MVKIKHKDMYVINKTFGMGTGYVLDFTNRTFREFFEDEFSDINLEQDKYCKEGDSKAKRLRAFIRIEKPEIVAKVLRELWNYRITIINKIKKSGAYNNEYGDDSIKGEFFKVISTIEKNDLVSDGATLDKFEDCPTLDVLMESINRDIESKNVSAAMDRLHTYCMKKFTFLLKKQTRKPLHTLLSMHLDTLIKQNKDLSSIKNILIKTIQIFEEFNKIRNNMSLAHNNKLVDETAACFVFNTISSSLKFIKSLDVKNFEE